MVSQPSRHTVRGALLATAVVVASSLPGGQAVAQPPANASDALKQYNDLSHEAEKLNDEHLKAQEDLKAKQGELDKANGDLNVAKQAEEALRGHVDLLTEASFEGARFNQLSALLVSESQQDFLNRMSALGVLASDNAEAMAKLQAAVDKANEASGKAKEATDAAQKLLAEIDDKKKKLDGQITEARNAYNRLSGSDQAALKSNGDMSKILVPPGTAGKALEFALAQRGDPYVYGANGPDAWDCSSLTQKSYASAGISIPRTSQAQAGIGVAVSRGNVKAGDLIIYYSSQTHVAMAIDGTRAVHASTEGQPVKIADIDSIGPISTIRRIDNS
ncbi:hydrolase Nlp/P60 [Lentzea sp. NBRC 105346]|uniref:C40 family peptidase n=1 Tax=Lentzea sp. NBRC 105346 TaxID=3032205 RepID=UPI0024A49E5E|nr:NlpC/P60 family protein [Lentzea sp. NBRC 105346]GLZ33721.1 hydrolase Nlp/P60 [Lentzea sp. NBRC 105346]